MRVNTIIDNRLDRESDYVRKQSVTVRSEAEFQKAFSYNCVQGEIPAISSETLVPPQEFVDEVKKDVKIAITFEENRAILSHVKTLVKQGRFLELTKVELMDATWQSYIYNLPKGTMKWLLNSSIDTLPTKANLKQWGKVSNDKCWCNCKQTLNHILNGCRKSLEQGRFTWRHDSILHYISNSLDKEKYTCFVDIFGHQTQAGGTLPPDIIISPLKPDIVVVDTRKKSVNIFELTVPGETRILEAHRIKTEKFQHFQSDIKSYKVSVIPFEVGSHTGYISLENVSWVNAVHKFSKKDIKLKNLKKNISSITVLSSYYHFNCRNY